MARPAATIPAGLAMLALLLPLGCGGEGAEGPAAGEGGGGMSLSELTPIPRAGEGVTRVTMILPGGVVPLAPLWEDAGRIEAARRGAVFAVKTPGKGESQAKLVREAGPAGDSVLIVLPGDPDALAPAIAEARGKGIEVVTLVEPVPDVEGEPVPAVVRADYREVADALVAATAEDAPKIGKSSSGPALVLAVEGFPEASARAEALREAAEAAGIATIGDGLRVVSPGEEEARVAIRETLAEHPDLAMVLAGDDLSFRAALLERDDRDEGEGFVAAGFVFDPTLLDAVTHNFASAAARADERELALLAVRNALALLRGEDVPDRVVVPLPLRRAPGPPTSEPYEMKVEAGLVSSPAGGPPGERQ